MSPVIATILMVAVTVVLAATVYIWVSGFGSTQAQAVTASFTARAVDLPGGDPDSSADALEIVFVQGSGDYSVSEVTVSVDGQALTNNGTSYSGGGWTITQSSMADGTWDRGDSIMLTKAGIMGTHLVRVTVQGQVVLDASVEVSDNP